MDIARGKNSLSETLVREDFKKKLKSWFENKGINKKLESYLRSQMIVEFQNTCGSTIDSALNPSISPKIQAAKLLVADFLVQEDLLFSLSVFVSEVPFLNNLSIYSQYVKELAQPRDSVSARPSKPKFTDIHLYDLCDALNLNLNKEEIRVIRNHYEAANHSSLLISLLSMLPVILKKYKNIDHILSKTRQKERYYRKLAKIEKTKTKQMYALLQEAHRLVQKHKTGMDEALQKHRECEERLISVEKQSVDLTRRENELIARQQTFESKERACEQKYVSKLREVEKKLKILEDHDREMQSKYKILQDEQMCLQTEKQQFEVQKLQIQNSNSQEVEKLEDYERKLCSLQEQVLEIVKKFDEKDKPRLKAVTNNREIQCAFDMLNQSQQTENDNFLNIEQYVNLVEKENALLKLSSNKQRYRINQLTSEVLALKNKLDFLENEIQIRKRLEHEERVHQVAHKLYFTRSPRETHATAASAATTSRSRRRLAFDEPPSHPIPIGGSESSELSASSSSTSFLAAHKLTDEIVADAKTKLKELEAESETLNRNFQNLQTVLARNMTFAERPFVAASTSFSDSSPNEKWQRRRAMRLTRSVSDLDSSSNTAAAALMSPDLSGARKSRRSAYLSDCDVSSPNSSRTDREASPSGTARGHSKREVAFSRMFQKYRCQKQTNDEAARKFEKESQPSLEAREQRGASTQQLLCDPKSAVGGLRPQNVRVPVVAGDENKDVVDGAVVDGDSRENVNVTRGDTDGGEDPVKNNGDLAARTDELRITTDQKPATENGNGQNESTSRSNEIISAGPSNGSNSSDFWK